MIYMCLVVFSFCALVAIINLVRTLWSLRWIENDNRFVAEGVDDLLEFVILVPLLREQAAVQPLLERLSRLEYPREKLRVVLITTEREKEADGPTTKELLAALLPFMDEVGFLHVHCVGENDTCKADQLNFAMRQVGIHGSRRDDLFIGVYDADSSPDPRILSYLADRIRKDPESKAFQQIPIYFQNTHAVQRSPGGFFLLSRPFHNLLFALTVELPEMHQQTLLAGKRRGSSTRIFRGWLSHAIGHGEFFRIDVLTDLGGFVPPSCDTQFGHALALTGIPLHPVGLLDVCETPDSVAVLMRQGVVWFNSLNTFWRTRRLVREIAPERYCPPEAWFMIARLIHSNVAWAVYPLVFLVCIVWSLLNGQLPLAVFGVTAWALYLLPLAVIMGKFDVLCDLASGYEPIRGFTVFEYVMILAMYPVEKLGACVGPLAWFAGKCREKIFGIPVELKKTERNGPAVAAQHPSAARSALREKSAPSASTESGA